VTCAGPDRPASDVPLKVYTRRLPDSLRPQRRIPSFSADRSHAGTPRRPTVGADAAREQSTAPCSARHPEHNAQASDPGEADAHRPVHERNSDSRQAIKTQRLMNRQMRIAPEEA